MPSSLRPIKKTSKGLQATDNEWLGQGTIGLIKNLGAIGGFVIGTALVLQPTQAQAQIQRSFINPSFELPAVGSACYAQVSPSAVPGWETTHGSVATGTGSCSGYVSPGNVPLIEIWSKVFSSVNTATGAGNQFAELNAEQASQLYQNLCLYNGETITFSLLHRGRSSATTADVANFLIGLNTDPTPTIFGRFSTTSNGTVTAQPVAQNGATIPAVSNNNAGNGWVRYNGSVPYTGTTGSRPVGFAAVSTAGGNNTVGNFLDDVQFAGKPVLELVASAGGAPEAETTPTTNPPKIRVIGLVPTGGITIAISVGGTAVLGTDFTTTSGTSTFTMTIPAGNYDGSNATSVFTVPFTVISNNVPQGSRTISFDIQPSSSFFSSSTMTCGGSPITTSTYTIYDDDFLSGKVWDDADNSANNTFTNINTGSETGTNAGGLLYAILVDSSNNVLRTTPVAADGTYTFIDVPFNQSNVKIILSTTAGTVGSAAPAASLPLGWVTTSPLVTAAFNTGTTIAGQDFGIEQLPSTTDLTSSAQSNPGGTATVQVPTLAGTDFEDGAIGSGKTFKIVTLPTNGILTYNNVAVTAGQSLSNYNPALLKLDPNDGALTVSFTYAVLDAAGKEDPTPATVTMPFSVASAIPQILLVKRITAMNGVNITTTIDDTGSTNDNAANWPNPIDATSGISSYLKGVINGGTIKPGDLLEYTIYFLSNGGAAATNINLCDLVPSNSTFVPDSFSSVPESGINLTIGATSTNLTNVPDTDSGQFFNPGGTPSVSCSATNTNGAVVVNVVKSPVNLPNATAPGTPTNSYGFIRFRARVN